MDSPDPYALRSEYYYGINEWFKIKLAANRFTKLVAFTRENDEARDVYKADGAKMLERLTAVLQLRHFLGGGVLGHFSRTTPPHTRRVV